MAASAELQTRSTPPIASPFWSRTVASTTVVSPNQLNPTEVGWIATVDATGTKGATGLSPHDESPTAATATRMGPRVRRINVATPSKIIGKSDEFWVTVHDRRSGYVQR
jgi:hypothetical protein